MRLRASHQIPPRRLQKRRLRRRHRRSSRPTAPQRRNRTWFRRRPLRACLSISFWPVERRIARLSAHGWPRPCLRQSMNKRSLRTLQLRTPHRRRAYPLNRQPSHGTAHPTSNRPLRINRQRRRTKTTPTHQSPRPLPRRKRASRSIRPKQALPILRPEQPRGRRPPHRRRQTLVGGNRYPSATHRPLRQRRAQQRRTAQLQVLPLARRQISASRLTQQTPVATPTALRLAMCRAAPTHQMVPVRPTTQDEPPPMEAKYAIRMLPRSLRPAVPHSARSAVQRPQPRRATAMRRPHRTTNRTARALPSRRSRHVLPSHRTPLSCRNALALRLTREQRHPLTMPRIRVGLHPTRLWHRAIGRTFHLCNTLLEGERLGGRRERTMGHPFPMLSARTRRGPRVIRSVHRPPGGARFHLLIKASKEPPTSGALILRPSIRRDSPTHRLPEPFPRTALPHRMSRRFPQTEPAMRQLRARAHPSTVQLGRRSIRCLQRTRTGGLRVHQTVNPRRCKLEPRVIERRSVKRMCRQGRPLPAAGRRQARQRFRPMKVTQPVSPPGVGSFAKRTKISGF